MGVVRRYCACLVGRVGEFTHQRKKRGRASARNGVKKAGYARFFLFLITQNLQTTLQYVIHWRLDAHHLTGSRMSKFQRGGMQEQAI